MIYSNQAFFRIETVGRGRSGRGQSGRDSINIYILCVKIKKGIFCQSWSQKFLPAAEDSLRLGLLWQGEDKARLCERDRDVCPAECSLQLLTDLTGVMLGLASSSPRLSGGNSFSSKWPCGVYHEFPICVVAVAWGRDLILNGLQIV